MSPGIVSAIAGLLLWGVPAFAQNSSTVVSPINSETISVRELAAIIAERDRQYAQRFEAQQQAVNSALAAQDKATAAAFAAAEKAVAAALAAQEKATAAAFSAANTAVSKAELANEKRLDSVNEFRAQLKDQAATLATRTEVGVQIKALNDKIESIATSEAQIVARGEGAANLWIIIAGIAGLIIGLAMAGATLFRLRRREGPEP
jgi:hypothetical protein